MFYIRWTEKEIVNLSKGEKWEEVLTEIDEDGNVKREIYLDKNGNVVHKAPTENDNYGIFDNQKVLISNLKNDLTQDEFEALWENL